jgi:small subunit ribosomal protein S16
MVKIRLTRAGARNRPFYRIVAVDERRPRDGRPLEFLGTFDPKVNPEKLSVRTDAVAAWVAKGAQLSPTVKSLLRRAKQRSASAASA